MRITNVGVDSSSVALAPKTNIFPLKSALTTDGVKKQSLTGNMASGEALITPTKQLALLLVFTVIFTSLHLATGYLHLLLNSSVTQEIYRFFNIGSDQNLPTFFATCQWLLAASLCWKLAFNFSDLRSNRRNWIAISMIALFIAADEYLMLHERTIEPIRSIVPDYPFLWFAWVIPYGFATVLVALLLFKFVFALPRRTAMLFCISGVVFVLGALGFEMLGAIEVANGNDRSVTYAALYTCEELLEMIGVSLFIYALLDYINCIEPNSPE